MFKGEEIDFSKIKDWEFEFICFELIQRNGFENVTWRKKGADNGRDIEATFRTVNNLTEPFEERWFFECKHYTAGLPPQELYSKIAWADAENIQHFVVMVSSHLTNGARVWLEKTRPQKKYKIHVLEGEKIKKLISKYPLLLMLYFVRGGIKNLLFETKKNWLTYGFLPSYDQLRTIIVKDDLYKLPKSDLAFLLCAYFNSYHTYKAHCSARGMEDEKVYKKLVPLLKRKSDSDAMIFNPQYTPHLRDVQGFVTDLDNHGDEFFIAGKSEVHKPTPRPFLVLSEGDEAPPAHQSKTIEGEGLYTFLKIDDNEYLETVVYRSSSFDTIISIVSDMKNWDLMFLMWSLGYSEEFSEKVFHQNFMNEEE